MYYKRTFIADSSKLGEGEMNECSASKVQVTGERRTSGAEPSSTLVLRPQETAVLGAGQELSS